MRHVTLVAFLCLTSAVGHAQQTTAPVVSNAPIYVRPEVLPTPLRVAAAGTKLNVLKVEGNWAQVEFKDARFGRRVGWVQLRLLEIRRAGLGPMGLSVPDTQPITTSSRSPELSRVNVASATGQPTSEASAITAAPVRGRLMHAKSAFVVNGGVWFKVFDKFYAELAKWDRFRLVQRKEDADITILLSSNPGKLFGGVAAPTGGVLIGGSESKFYVRISDTRDGTPLWADMTGETRSVSNSGKRLVSNLRKGMDEK
jgi:hypothetical protein